MKAPRLVPRVAWLAALAPALCAQASVQAASVNALLATARQRIETADLRATGHLVWAPESGPRVNFPITVRAHWFPGVLRVLVEVGQPSSAHRDMREHILLEMRPDGDNSIRVADPGDAAPRIVPFEKWNAHSLTPGFSYEDFLEQQYFWPGQVSEGKQMFGARECEVIKSTPGSADRTHYASVKTWLDPAISFPVYIEKTFKETGEVKQFTSYGIRHEEGVWSAHQVEVKVRGQAGSTFLIFDRGSAKARLTIDDFSPAQLTRF